MKYTFLLLLAVVQLPAKDSCLECHSHLEGDFQAPAVAFKNSVHLQHGFTCAACNGGDPNSDDPDIAMSKARGFVGVPARTAIPKLCARCHSDPNMIGENHKPPITNAETAAARIAHGFKVCRSISNRLQELIDHSSKSQ